MRNWLFLMIAGLAISACTTVPPTNVHQPMSARPAPRTDTLPASGTIYQAGASRTLFEDRRAVSYTHLDVYKRQVSSG